MIPRIEYIFLKKIIEKKNIIFVTSLFIIALLLRISGRNFLSGDMQRFLIPWFIEIKGNGGLHSLTEQVGDYGLLYQTLISLMTYIDINPLYLYKLLSVIFDIFLAYSVYKVVKLTNPKQSKIVSIISGGVIMLLPTVIINSSYWGQCDSMYSFFCISCLYQLHKESYLKSFIFLGLAFACKLQSVFILPFIFFYYLKDKRFSVLYFLISIFVVWLVGIIAFCEGRSLLTPIEIYHYQTFEYQAMYMNFPSFWMIAGNDYSTLKVPSVLFTGLLVLVGGFYYLSNEKYQGKNEFWQVVTWFVWTMVLFLPSMHERYAYLLDILLILLCFENHRFIKYAIITSCLSLYAYGNYLFDRERDPYMQFCAFLFVLTYVSFSYSLLVSTKERTCLK